MVSLKKYIDCGIQREKQNAWLSNSEWKISRVVNYFCLGSDYVQTQPNNIMIDNTIMEILQNYLPMDLVNIVEEYSKDRTNYDITLIEMQMNPLFRRQRRICTINRMLLNAYKWLQNERVN